MLGHTVCKVLSGSIVSQTTVLSPGVRVGPRQAGVRGHRGPGGDAGIFLLKAESQGSPGGAILNGIILLYLSDSSLL